VSSVSKSLQKASRSAAAVYVISQEDIRRSGADSLPEVLRLAPGVHVARIIGSSWAVGIRGFNNIYSNKLLVMIDGRTIYIALLSGVLWSENLVMLDDIERIEVIRGPGATMWGANAVSGVINIITRSAQATVGGMAAVNGGTFAPLRARVRFGRPIGDSGAWRAWGQYGLQGHTYPSPGAARPGSWPTVRGGVRFELQPTERDAVLIEGEIHRNSIAAAPEMATAFAGPARPNTGTTNGYLMGRWSHTNRRGDPTTLQAYENLDAIDAGSFTAGLRTFDLDLHHTIHLRGNHDLLIGGGLRHNSISTTGTPGFSFDPASRGYRNLNLYAQDSWGLVRDRLTLDLGAKAEHYEHAGFAFEPTARLMWTPSASQGYWLSVSRAVRTPAHTDWALRVPIFTSLLPVPLMLSGSDGFRPENLTAFEAGARFELRKSLAFDVSLFRHQYTRLHSYAIGAGMPATFGTMPAIPAATVNGMDGVNTGAEVSGHYRARGGWQLGGSYSSLFSRTTVRPGFNPAAMFELPYYTPRHQWQVRVS
jgi:iron complex outermembrane receptor protein